MMLTSSEPYLELLKRTLTGMIYKDAPIPLPWRPETMFNEAKRETGRDWPQYAHTMIGIKRLDNLQWCIEQVLTDQVPGDLIETGVWRGGACVFMRGVLKAYMDRYRTVWVADSFQGLPQRPKRWDDAELAAQPEQAILAVSRRTVEDNFLSYRLLDKQVKFLEGWFRDTLPGPVEQLAVLRLDGDLYESTMDVLQPLYPLLSPGGFCIIDDWNIPMCREAVCEYRDSQDVKDEMINIDGHSVFWRKS